jgi:hypothetical protein
VTVEFDADSCRRCGANSVEFLDPNGTTLACMTFSCDIERVETGEHATSARQDYGMDDRRLEPKL